MEKSLACETDDLTGSSQDSDPEVVIESEEIVEISTPKVDKPTKMPQSQKKGDNKSPSKKYTSLGDMMMGQSPAKQKLLTEQGRDEIKKMLQRTGKVVAITEKKHSRACTGFIKPMQDRSTDKAFFSPVDHRVPRIIIPIENCPKGLLVVRKIYKILCQFETFYAESIAFQNINRS